MRKSFVIKDHAIIRNARNEIGLTVSKLGELVNVTKGFISRIENGKARISEDLAIRL